MPPLAWISSSPGPPGPEPPTMCVSVSSASPRSTSTVSKVPAQKRPSPLRVGRQSPVSGAPSSVMTMPRVERSTPTALCSPGAAVRMMLRMSASPELPSQPQKITLELDRPQGRRGRRSEQRQCQGHDRKPDCPHVAQTIRKRGSYAICMTSPAWFTCIRRTRMAPGRCRRSRRPLHAPKAGRGAAHRSRHAGGKAARRGGLVRRRAPAGRRGGFPRRGKNHLPGLRHRRAHPPPRARRVRDRARGARRRRLRLRRAPVLRGLRALQATRHAVRRARLRRTPRDRAVELRERHGASRRRSPDACDFVAAPGRVLDHPPERNMRRWDELCRERRVVGDRRPRCAPVRQAGRPVVPVRRDGLPPQLSDTSGRTSSAASRRRASWSSDRELVFDALRAGRCYIGVDSVAPASGFRFEADDVPMGGEAPAGRRTLRMRTPLAARLRLLRDGAEIASTEERRWTRMSRNRASTAPRPCGRRRGASGRGSFRIPCTCGN